ncbi:MAG: molybdenum cofactor guanylyltransferase [Eubacterium sp.]
MNQFKTAAILVGGKSTRMGYDKKNLKIAGKTLLQSVIDQLQEIFEEIIVIGCASIDIDDIKGISGVYPDAIDAPASLTGIYTALLYGQSDYVYVTACDMPNYNLDYIGYMMEQLENDKSDGCVARYKEWIEPFNAFYSKELLTSMEKYIKNGRKSIFKYLENQEITYIEEIVSRLFSPNWEMFCNLNTPKDLKEHLKGIYYVNQRGRNFKNNIKRL